MQEYWTTNIERLAKKQPDLARNLGNIPLHNIRLMRNDAGLMVGQTWDVATQQWVSLCDANDPITEAENDAAALWTKDARLFICFGLGLGYFPAAFARKLLPYQRLAIFDPNPMHYLGMLHAIDAEILQGERHVETFIGDGLVPICEKWWLGLQSHEKLHIGMPIRSGFTAGCNVDVYEALLEKTGQMLLYHGVGLATWRQFGGHIGHSDWGNLPEYFLTPGFQELEGLWAGKPAVCIAAGPSLKKNVALLCNPEFRNKVAVITVGTTYALLQSLGIQPDIVTTIDFQRLNWTDQFLHVPLDDAPPLVYLHSTHPSSVRRWPGVKYVGLNSSDTTAWMAQFAEPKASAGQVQSVAHLNLVIAQMLGASPIILLGQDLSMTPTEHHALGARAQDMPPQDHMESHIEMSGFDGQPVWSRQSLLSMKLVFEQLIAAAPGQPVINCTEGGLALAGAPNMSLAQALTDAPLLEGARLRTLVEQRAHTYTSQVRWDDLMSGISGISTALQRLNTVALRVLAERPAWEAATTPDERAGVYARVKDADSVFNEEGLAFGQIAIRRFEIIELISAIPPAPDTPQSDLDTINMERLLTVARVVAEDSALVLAMLTQCHKRLQDIRDLQDAKPVTRAMFARESYPAIAQAAAQHGLPDPASIVALAWAQQRYQGLHTLAALTPAAQRLAPRVRRLLDKHDTERHTLGWSYLAPRKEA